ncbi:MAG: hypothetical protein ACXVWU_09315 [Nocardioides sp.]
MTERAGAGAAFYAHTGSRAADWWTVLHPPYTLWHLSYVALGAAVAPAVHPRALVASLLAFFLAVGIAAHALDELHGRPLGTSIGDGTLRGVAAVALAGAALLGVDGVLFEGPVNWPLALAVPVGVLLVVAYNLELFGGRLHNDATFAWAWGGFPVAVGYLAQAPGPSWASAAAAVAAVLAGVGTSAAQRALSTVARDLRRRTAEVTGTVVRLDGTVTPLDRQTLLAPPERALRALSWALPVLACAVLLARA